MCGILGFCSSEKKYQFKKYLETLKHRGPDQEGFFEEWQDNNIIQFGFRRLSIQDLSLLANQPMSTDDGRFTIIFNGEIYNYIELKKELKILGYKFKSSGDTEVLLKAWHKWGISTLDKIEGMFAFAIYDRLNKVIFLARDPYGIKPLYYINSKEGFLFSSELNSLSKMKNEASRYNKKVVAKYLVEGKYDRTEETFYDGIKRLLPGHFLQFSITKKRLLTPKKWYNPSIKENRNISYKTACTDIRDIFLESVKMQLRSDVPVGVSLSGGLDSSSVVSAIRYIYKDLTIKTFSFTTNQKLHDERKWIDVVNNRLGAISHFTSFEDYNLSEHLEDFIKAQGEPVNTLSYLAEFLVYNNAKENKISVMLDGHGADEILGGYSGYPVEKILSLYAKKDFMNLFNFIYNWSDWPGRNRIETLKHLILAIASISKIDIENLKSIIKSWKNSKSLFSEEFMCELGGEKIFSNKKIEPIRCLIQKLKEDVTLGNCPPQLRSADRSAMFRSIENRVPFLTPKLVNYILQLPEDFIISNKGRTKHIFKDAMRGIVPEEIILRKDKIGFATPNNLEIIISKKIKEKILSGFKRIGILNPKLLSNFFLDTNNNKIRLDDNYWRFFNLICWAEEFDIN